MSRIIKFRFWNKNHKEMQFDLGLLPFSFQEKAILKGLLENGSYVNPNNDSWFITMQFTGLLDKNGTEIYEGDIVHIKHSFRDREWTGAVVWANYGFTGDGFYFTHYDIPSDLFGEGTEFIEVIGNIYENPELLKDV